MFHEWSNDIKISSKLSQRLFGILRLCPVLEGPLSFMPLQEASPPPSHHAPPSHHHILPGCLRSQGPRDTQCMQNAKQGMGWNAPSMWACLVTDSPIVKLKTRCQDQRLQNVFPSWMKVVVFFALSLSLSMSPTGLQYHQPRKVFQFLPGAWFLVRKNRQQTHF